MPAEPNILVINLGSVSSKFALFSGKTCQAEQSYELDVATAKQTLAQQRGLRLAHLQQFLTDTGQTLDGVSALAARGGMMKSLPARGVYAVDQQMLDDLTSERFGSHPANLSAIIAVDLAKTLPKMPPVYIIDPIVVDTITDEARVSGVPGITRQGRQHTLNMHQAALRAAETLGQPLHNLRLVIGHFGSGVSIGAVENGRVIDVNDALLGEGPFSVARAGTLPIRGVLDLAYATPDRKQLEQRLSRQVGLAGYLGTSDFREVEQRLEAGDAAAHAAYRAMVYQSAKYIASYAGCFTSAPDAIVLTGGLLKSERFAADLAERIGWLGEIVLIPGEDEMPALAHGVYRALKGEEPVLDYSHAGDPLAAPPRNYREVMSRAVTQGGVRFVVAGGHHPEIAETVALCREQGITNFTLVGPKAEILQQFAAWSLTPAMVEIIDSTTVEADAIAAVQQHPGSVLVKGNCNTAALLKQVLSCLPEGSSRPFLSHVAVLENPLTGRLIGITDGGLNMHPDRDKKIAIMTNAIAMFQALGITKPHVILTAGMEDKGQDFPEIVDAREITAQHRAGAWPEAVIDGPFGIDVGLSAEAAALKGIKTPVAGRADIIVTPNLESSNFAIKTSTMFTGSGWGGVVVGGPFPVVVGSRSDDAHTRVCSIALAQLVATGMAALLPNRTQEAHG
jgi:butyrate kinase